MEYFFLDPLYKEKVKGTFFVEMIFLQFEVRVLILSKFAKNSLCAPKLIKRQKIAYFKSQLP